MLAAQRAAVVGPFEVRPGGKFPKGGPDLPKDERELEKELIGLFFVLRALIEGVPQWRSAHRTWLAT